MKRVLLVALLLPFLALAQRELSPQKDKDDSDDAPAVSKLTYDQAIERYGIPTQEKQLSSGKVVAQWERQQGVSGYQNTGSGYGTFQGGQKLIMTCVFSQDKTLEKRTFNFGPNVGSDAYKQRQCERVFLLN